MLLTIPGSMLEQLVNSVKLKFLIIYRGYVEQATSVGKVMTNLAGISADNYTQTKIDQDFS